MFFLVRFNNFDRTTGFYWSYTLLLKPPVLCTLDFLFYESLAFLLHELIVFLCCSHQDPQELLQACKQGDLEAALRSLAADVDVDIKLDSVRLVFVVESHFHI